jgi:hypothetical protein
MRFKKDERLKLIGWAGREKKENQVSLSFAAVIKT